MVSINALYTKEVFGAYREIDTINREAKVCIRRLPAYR